MPDYDFRILQPNEFECLTLDLLQAREGLRIESFAAGRDNGIDLRFAYDSFRRCIVQCKRYWNWRELKSSLLKEVPKVVALKPERYIVSTSVSLTAANKDEIKAMFSPFIKDTATDVLGADDLNNMLGHLDTQEEMLDEEMAEYDSPDELLDLYNQTRKAEDNAHIHEMFTSLMERF